MPEPSLCVVNVVGLTPGHVGPDTPHLSRLARERGIQPLAGITPAVTCSAQATLLTGQLPSVHGIVANGWLYRDTMEARLWQQSNRLLQSEPVYVTARRRARERGQEFGSAQLFWWFNQGAAVDWSLTPKPHYGCDGSKVFGISGTPEGFATAMEKELGAFPFHTFWGPMAGLPCSRWIAEAAARVLKERGPRLSLVYLPHLDYDLQRFGPACEHLPKLLGEVDACVGTIVEAAAAAGIEPLIVSEYGLLPVSRPVLPNRRLRTEGMLAVREGPFGEMLDTFGSMAFAVCDHQIAHVYVDAPHRISTVASTLSDLEGVAEILVGERRDAVGLDHPRSGEIVLLAERDAWFAYPYWLEHSKAPDFAHTVDIHRKVGYDPCELFFDPHIPAPKLRAAMRLIQKKLGMRYKMDVIGLDPTIVRGSHGVAPARLEDGPVLIGAGAGSGASAMPMTGVRDLILEGLGLADSESG